MMLNIEDYQKINQFKNLIHCYHFKETKCDSFRKFACNALDEFFSHHHIVFGFLNNTTKHETSLNVLIHNTPDNFVQAFFLSGILSESPFLNGCDIVSFSSLPNYKKRRLYKELMRDYNYGDFLICYLNLDTCYNGFLLLFRDKNQKIYSGRDIEILKEIGPFLAIEYMNCLKIVQLRNFNHQLVSQTNLYPMGVVILKDFLTVDFMNDTAEKYMEELEIASPKYFSVFFNNHIVPKIKNNLLLFGNKQIIRYKNFIFTIATTTPTSKAYFESNIGVDNFVPSIQEALSSNHTTYVYLWRDELSSYSKSKSFFNDFNFTKREQEVAECILKGLDVHQIASELEISVNTVKVHIQKLYRKTGVSSMAEFIFHMNHH